MEHGAWSMDGSMEHGAWSVECRVWSMEYGVVLWYDKKNILRLFVAIFKPLWQNTDSRIWKFGKGQLI
jgi:hypothetical protein